MHISDIVMEVFAMESSLLRSRKLAASGEGVNAATCTPCFCVRPWIGWKSRREMSSAPAQSVTPCGGIWRLYAVLQITIRPMESDRGAILPVDFWPLGATRSNGDSSSAILLGGSNGTDDSQFENP